MKKSISDILKGCLKNQRVSQKMLFDTYNPDLLSLAYRITGDKEKAKETTQECWIDIFNSLGNYDDKKGSFKNWAKTILVRKAWKHIYPNTNTVELENNIYQNSDSSTDEKMDSEQLINQMKYIPTSSRIVFQLFIIDGYKHAEIGELLNISESTSRVHLSKARKIMKERYLIINKISCDEL